MDVRLTQPRTHSQHPDPKQIELESGCGGGGAEVQKKHSERWTEDLFGRGTSGIHFVWCMMIIMGCL